MNRQDYFNLMEMVLSAYSFDDIKSYTKEVEKRGIWEHGFPRLTANIGILLAHGKVPQYKDCFSKMMGICCEEIPIALKKTAGRRGMISR